MKGPVSKPSSPGAGEQGSVRLVLLMLTCFLLGIATGGLLFHRSNDLAASEGESQLAGQSPAENPAPRDMAPGVTGAASPGEALRVGQADPAVIAHVKHLLPNPETVSLKEGTRILRKATLKDFEAAAKRIEQRISQAQEHLRRAQENQSEAEQEAAIKQLRQTQNEGDEELKQISARLQAEVAALEALKRR